MKLLTVARTILKLNKATVAQEMLKLQGIRYASLMRQQAYVGGKWVDASSRKTFDVTNPANGEVIGSVPDMEDADVQVAIDSAYDAFQTWQRTTAKERSALIRRWFNLMEEHKEDLAVILTAEAGKPLMESLGELAYGSSFLEWYAEEAKRIYGEVGCSPSASKEIIFIRQPIGVAALITPWNFPNAMITRKAGAALAAGCTCVIKPAEDTPLSALAAADLAHKAGFPPGVVNFVTCSRSNAAAVGNLLCESSKVAGVSFTGSTAVGKLLFKQCAGGIKRIGLELGGNAPFIVFNSANMNSAIDGLLAAKFRNAGQACISANRILVQSEIHDNFVESLQAAMKQRLIVADGMKKESTIGPLINKAQLLKVAGIVKESKAQGAKVVLGGKVHSLGGLFYEPTLLTNVNQNMKCFKEEIFGPVVAIKKFETEEEALLIANDSNSGLAGYFYSQDVSQVWRVARRLETGMIGINEGFISTAEAAFGGIKQSGIGREGSKHGIDDYTYIKYLCFGGIN